MESSSDANHTLTESERQTKPKPISGDGIINERKMKSKKKVRWRELRYGFVAEGLLTIRY